jgi:hypothetical protein
VLITNIVIGTCILSACLFPSVSGPHTRLYRAPYAQRLFILLKPTYVRSEAPGMVLCDDILWTQVPSEEPLADIDQA